MDVEHRLTQRIGVLSSGGADEIIVKKSYMKVGTNSNIGLSTLLVLEFRSPMLAVEIALNIHHGKIDFLQLVHTRDTGLRKVWVKNWIYGCIGDVAFDITDIANDRAVCYHSSAIHQGCVYSIASKHGIVVRYVIDNR
jgi:hypothetical protein